MKIDSSVGVYDHVESIDICSNGKGLDITFYDHNNKRQYEYIPLGKDTGKIVIIDRDYGR